MNYVKKKKKKKKKSSTGPNYQNDGQEGQHAPEEDRKDVQPSWEAMQGGLETPRQQEDEKIKEGEEVGREMNSEAKDVDRNQVPPPMETVADEKLPIDSMAKEAPSPDREDKSPRKIGQTWTNHQGENENGGRLTSPRRPKKTNRSREASPVKILDSSEEQEDMPVVRSPKYEELLHTAHDYTAPDSLGVSIVSLEAFDQLIDSGFALENLDDEFAVGPKIKKGQIVTFHCISASWEGAGAAAKVFECTRLRGRKPRQILVGRREMTEGMDIALMQLHVGCCVRVICAPRVAYGETGFLPNVPPNSYVVYDIEILEARGGHSKKVTTAPQEFEKKTSTKAKAIVEALETKPAATPRRPSYSEDDALARPVTEESVELDLPTTLTSDASEPVVTNNGEEEREEEEKARPIDMSHLSTEDLLATYQKSEEISRESQEEVIAVEDHSPKEHEEDEVPQMYAEPLPEDDEETHHHGHEVQTEPSWQEVRVGTLPKAAPPPLPQKPNRKKDLKSHETIVHQQPSPSLGDYQIDSENRLEEEVVEASNDQMNMHPPQVSGVDADGTTDGPSVQSHLEPQMKIDDHVELHSRSDPDEATISTPPPLIPNRSASRKTQGEKASQSESDRADVMSQTTTMEAPRPPLFGAIPSREDTNGSAQEYGIESSSSIRTNHQIHKYDDVYPPLGEIQGEQSSSSVRSEERTEELPPYSERGEERNNPPAYQRYYEEVTPSVLKVPEPYSHEYAPPQMQVQTINYVQMPNEPMSPPALPSKQARAARSDGDAPKSNIPPSSSTLWDESSSERMADGEEDSTVHERLTPPPLSRREEPSVEANQPFTITHDNQHDQETPPSALTPPRLPQKVIYEKPPPLSPRQKKPVEAVDAMSSPPAYLEQSSERQVESPIMPPSLPTKNIPPRVNSPPKVAPSSVEAPTSEDASSGGVPASSLQSLESSNVTPPSLPVKKPSTEKRPVPLPTGIVHSLPTRDTAISSQPPKSVVEPPTSTPEVFETGPDDHEPIDASIVKSDPPAEERVRISSVKDRIKAFSTLLSTDKKPSGSSPSLPQRGTKEGNSTNTGTRFYTLEELTRKPYPSGIDVTVREKYLSPYDFEKAFGMTPAEFATVPKWKQRDMKKDLNLF